MTRTAILGLVALLVVSALGWWGLDAYRRSQLHRTVAALVTDSSRRLETALALEKDPAAESSQQTVSKLDEQAQEVDRHVIALHDLRGSANPPLVDAANDYLLTVRQILRQQAASHRYRLQVAATDAALREHMHAAGRRSGAWIDEAVRIKDLLERHYFDYRVSADALVRLLASYSSARKGMAAQLSAPLLGDDAVEDARARTEAVSKRVAASVAQARQLAAVR